MTHRCGRRLGYLIIGLVGLLAWPSTALSQRQASAIERDFVTATQAAARGDYATAIRLFSALSAETHEARVDLELGRVLFLAGDFARAKQVFLRAYHGPLPYPVRRSVDVFLDDIDQRLGYLRPSVGLVVDSNPTAAAASGVYDLFGAPLSYKTTARSSLGVSYRLDGLAPIGRQGDRQWQVVGSTGGLWFDRQDARRYDADLGLRAVDLAGRAYATAGWRGTLTQFQRTSAPYVAYERRLISSRDREIDLAASLEINRFPGQAYLRGETVRGSSAYASNLGPATSWRVTGGGSLSSIDDFQWPRSTVFGQATLARSLPGLNLNLLTTATLSAAGYGALDPLFGKTRNDRSARLDLALYQGRPVFGLFPGVVASLEQRRSNIDFYGYRRAGLSVDLRRRF